MGTDLLDFNPTKEEYVAFLQKHSTMIRTFHNGPGKWTIKEAILHVTDTEGCMDIDP